MKVYCPYCTKEVEYNIEKRKIENFRGIKLDTYEKVGICNICKNDLYINELEEENNKRIYKAYSEKTDIIKPEDIINLRKKYSISQRELTSILGFGKMTINRYENGGIPTKSQSDYIKLLIENENEFIKKVKEAYSNNNITQKTYDKIIVNDLDANIKKEDIQELYRKYISNELTRNPDIYNGYKVFDLELVENIISYIASKVKNLTITSMNKYLWFIDNLSFNQRGIGITGLTYQKQQYGPTISNKLYEDISMLNNKYKRNDYEDETGTKTIITSNKNYNLNKLQKSEIEIINNIIKLLKDKNVSEISELSHKEDGWKKTKQYENISFDYAMKLNIVKE
ncbi:MAG: DUF4065 domain-containing protein [Clostridiales bacterium]|nr:DUF4065 domain-containing protein [Clostridiales bacterium]